MLRSSLMARAAERANRRAHMRRGRARGFTLTELMAVVAITGILATLAIATLRQRAFASDVASAEVVVRTIVAAEEHYRAENQVYLNVSSPGDTGWYPEKTVPPNTKVSFWKATPDAGADSETVQWKILNPDIRQPVTFGFKANAGLPDTTPKFEGELAAATPSTVNVVEPWYLIQARADADGDGTACMVGAASWSPNVVSVNDGE